MYNVYVRLRNRLYSTKRSQKKIEKPLDFVMKTSYNV